MSNNSQEALEKAAKRKQKYEAKYRKITIRVTEAEKQDIEKMVAQSNLDQNALLRKAIFNTRIFVKYAELPSKEHGDVRIHLAQIGNNVNQIAKRLHQQQGVLSPELHDQLLESFSQLSDELKELNQAYF